MLIARETFHSDHDYFPQIISAPEVIQSLSDLPTLHDLVKSLYECHYAKFFVALGKFLTIIAFLSTDLNPWFSQQNSKVPSLSRLAISTHMQGTTFEKCASSHTRNFWRATGA